MSHTDPDVVAVRELPPGVPDPSDESVSRTWRLITARRPAPAPLWTRLLVPVTAAAMVVGLAVGATVVFRPGGLSVGAGGVPSDEKTSEPNLAPPSPEAVAALKAMAEVAAGKPTTVPPIATGQYVFVRHDGWVAVVSESSQVAKVEKQDRDYWFDPQGGLLRGSSFDGAPPRVEDQEVPREQVLGSVIHPTPKWLAQLPTDPIKLLDDLRGAMDKDAPWSIDHQVWTAMQDLYMRCDVLLNTEGRAALLRAFTSLRGITSSEVTIDKRRLLAIRHTERGSGDEILFDPTTGRAVGRRSVNVNSTLTLDPASPVRLDPGVTYQATWSQQVVDELYATS
ncbi:CU044_5270 family protein [Micromonospora sp. CPCC 205371]|nr:CU044_5270 family protein [Micromonospora sp. CPCC 205371]